MHVFKGQESEAVARLSDLSLPSKRQQPLGPELIIPLGIPYGTGYVKATRKKLGGKLGVSGRTTLQFSARQCRDHTY